MHAVDAAGAAETGALRQTPVDRLVEQLLDLLLDVVGKLEALRAEQLDAVVLEQIMRGGDHDAEIGAHRLGQHRNRRRRHRAEQQHVHADRGKAGDHGVFDHVAGETGVLADDDAVAMIATLKHQAGRLPHLERELRRDQSIGAAPNSVGTEIFAAHVTPKRFLVFLATWATNPRTPSIVACSGYNPSAAKMASKNMMNHYGHKRPFSYIKPCFYLIFPEIDNPTPKPLAAAFEVVVALRGRRLGDIDRIGRRKGLFQTFVQGVVETPFFLAIAGAGVGFGTRSGHGMSSSARCDLADQSTMLDDNP